MVFAKSLVLAGAFESILIGTFLLPDFRIRRHVNTRVSLLSGDVLHSCSTREPHTGVVLCPDPVAFHSREVSP